ncbi:putative transcriptional regulatory protein [Colletotrichum fructicola Nara gc5]|uniref:Putative transcriptional regulatory protein n=1 Tax=Colletotrichum fructicola (strain Nara gc5) TaxID=1213859 RepID=A0A7J6J5Y4_COLFN|nr:putative transcriptional regulatory protein [Colletotrichum fructicola Nara gc5]
MPEIGSLRALANGESQFVGSSSGVYFINTVRRAFSAQTSATADANQLTNDVGAELRDDPSPEDCIVGAGGDDETEPDENADNAGHHESHPQSHDHLSPFSTGSDFINVPFLQGPECLAELDALYASTEHDRRNVASLSRLVIFRCIFSIARLDSDVAVDIGSAGIRSSSDLLPTLSLLALRSDACSIQALLSAQVYFISVMSLRHASSVGGLISKSIFQSGMHRCPVRYGHLSPDERSMRKRIFWSFYVLDRFVSQSLGHPSGIQDSDIDVCPPGHRDLHEPVAQSALSPASAAADNTILHLPANHPERCAKSRDKGEYDSDSSTEVEEGDQNAAPNSEANASSAKAAAILRHRQETQNVLQNHADVAAWGNDLTEPRPGPTLMNIPELTPDPTVFPYITYHYTVLLLNRPSLSLDSRCAEFRAALQTCISAAKAIVPTVDQYHQTGGPLFWPGYMSAVWMSGLVLALAARVKSYSLSRAKSDIRTVLKLLTVMESRWRMAKDCKGVLSVLLDNIEHRSKGHKRTRTEGDETPSPIPTNSDGSPRTTKRQMTQAPSAGLRGRLDRAHGRSSRSSHAIAQNRSRTPLPHSAQRSVRFHDSRSDNFYYNMETPQHIPSSHEQMTTFSPGFSTGEATLFGTSQDMSFQNNASNMSTYFSQIPTTFPDRQRTAQGQMDQYGHTDNFFDMFDGATWGSLIDIVNDAGTGM